MIDKLKELNETATPGPWSCHDLGLKGPGEDNFIAQQILFTDMALIVEMRNALPKLLKLFEVAKMVNQENIYGRFAYDRELVKAICALDG